MCTFTQRHVCTWNVCAHPKGSLAGCLYLFLKKNKYKKTFETMLNYFTIPEIDIAFTIATTKLWSIQQFKIVGSILCVDECLWVYICVYVCVYVYVCLYNWYHLQSNGKIFIKLNVVLLPKKHYANVASVRSNYSNWSNIFFHVLLYFPFLPVNPVRWMLFQGIWYLQNLPFRCVRIC